MKHFRGEGYDELARLFDADHTALLDNGEERALIIKVHQGDPIARNRLALANIRLIVSIAKPYLAKGLRLDDLVQEGFIGLLEACDRVDPAFETKFSTYATWWIRQAIRAALSANRVIVLDRRVVNGILRWVKMSKQLSLELGRTATEKEIAKALGMTGEDLDDLRLALRADSTRSSTNSAGEEDSFDIFDHYIEEDSLKEQRAVESAEIIALVQKFIAQLGETERFIISSRYEIGDHPRLSITEIAKVTKQTSGSIRSIETAVKKRLQRLLEQDLRQTAPDSEELVLTDRQQRIARIRDRKNPNK
jgi:RNA polymerase primary sigma factor